MAANYRMRGYDTTLTRLVFWTATIVDTTAAQYTGPGPVTGIVIQDVSGGGSDGANNVLTWRPGSAETGPVVFSSFAALYAQLETLRNVAVDSGEFVIVFDDSMGLLNVPVGTFDMIRTAWHGILRDDATGFVPASLPAGAVINNLGSISGLVVTGNVTSPNIELAVGQSLDLHRATLKSTGYTSLVHLSGRAAIHLGTLSTVINTGDGSVTGTIAIDGGIILDAYLDGVESSIGGNTFAGDGSTQVALIVGDSSASYVTGQNHLTGPVTITQRAAAWSGSGDPNGVVNAGRGLLYTDSNTGFVYRNTTGLTAWEQLGVEVLDVGPLGPSPVPGGTFLFGMAITPDDSRVYVGNGNPGFVDTYYFNTTTNLWNPTGVGTLGTAPNYLQVSLDGSKLYASNYYAGTVTVINAITFAPIATIPGFTNPSAMAITPDGLEIWVVNSDDKVRRISTVSDTIVGAAISTGGATNPFDITFLPNGTKAYVTGGGSNTVVSISTTTHLVVNTVGVQTNLGIAALPDSSEVWVCEIFNGDVVRIETTGDTIVGSPIPVGAFPRSIRFALGGTKAFVGNQSDSTVSVIDVGTHAVTTTIPGVGTNPRCITVNNAGTLVYVSCGTSLDIIVIDATAETVVAMVTSTPKVETDLGYFSKFAFEGTTLLNEGGGKVRVTVAPIPPFDSFVFQPGGGQTGPVIFDNFDTLYAALILNPGPATLFFDDQFVTPGPISIPGNSYDMTNVPWRGLNGIAGTAETITDVQLNTGCQIFGLREISHLRLEATTGTAATAPISDMTDGDIFILDDHAILRSTWPVISLANVADGKAVYLDVRNGSQILNADGPPIVFNSTNGITLTVQIDKSSLVESNTFGDGTGTGTGKLLSFSIEGASGATGFPAVQSYYTGNIGMLYRPSPFNTTINQTPLSLSQGSINLYPNGFATDVNLWPASWMPGGWVYIKNSSTETKPLTIYPSGCDTIEGKAHYVIGAAGASVRLVSDGVSNWNVVSSHQAPGSYVFMEGEIPSGTGSVELTLNAVPFYFELVDDTNYTLLVTAIAHGVSPGTTNQSFRQMFSVRRAAGTTTIAAAGALEQIGDAGGVTWTLVASVGAGPDRFALTFSNGVSSTYVRVRAKIEIVEVYVPPM